MAEVTIPLTRHQAHIPDVEPTMHGLTEALAQLALSGVPPVATIYVMEQATSHGSRLLVAVDWMVEG